MQKKAFLSLLLIFVMLFSMASCGNKEESETTATERPVFTPPTEQQGDVQTPTEKETFAQPEKELISVSIPEGYTLVRISWLLEEKGICSSDAFLKAAQQYDLSKYSILKDVKQQKDVCFPLEGYLFPATYAFKKGTAPQTILDEMVKTANARFSSLLPNGKSAQGYNLHQILTIASIIEKEAFTSDQRTKISAVLHNRLKQKMKLQCDVTVKYCTGVIEHVYPDKIDHYKYLYNTYRCAGLPAGPICNPGMESIRAALNPENSKALYFAIATDPPYESRFAETYEQHQKNCKELGL